MHLHPIPALQDNYIWLLQDRQGHALVVDPGDAEPVFRALERQPATLTDILLTHHHADHIGGAAVLADAFGARIVAPHDPRIPHADLRVTDGDTVTAAGHRFQVLEVPGHTRSHVAYFGAGLLFSGDTLFSLGCGRLFEGTPAQMLTSLDRLASLPAATQVCCGHEYTLANAAFAARVDGGNTALAERTRAAQTQRAAGLPTLPVGLDMEKLTNPFLRIDSAALIQWAADSGINRADRVARFAALREAKDEFRA